MNVSRETSDKALSDFARWKMDGVRNSWIMPEAHWLKRLPVVRHLRALRLMRRVSEHNALWRSMGSIPSGFDEWVIYGIYHGEERSRS